MQIRTRARTMACLAAVACCATGGAWGQTDFTVTSALGDSLTDVPDERGPGYAEHIAEQLDVELHNFALSGATTVTLLESGQHTDAVDAGTTFAFLWIGANDLLFENAEINALGIHLFVPEVIMNWETAADALQASGATVITANLPDLSRLAGSAERAEQLELDIAGDDPEGSEFSAELILANVQGGTIAFNEALAESAAERGIPVVDVFDMVSDLIDTKGTVCGTPIGLPPNRGAPTDLFFDEIHPSSLGMGLVTNAFIEVMNAELGMELQLLTQAELGALAGIEVCVIEPPADSDGDGVVDNEDLCPGEDDLLDSDGDGTPDCLDGCPEDGGKTSAGACGCGVADDDGDEDGTPDCNDACPDDPDKVDLGICGCGVPDTDTDLDGVADCVDNCPEIDNTTQIDRDGDGVGDVCDDDGGANENDNDGGAGNENDNDGGDGGGSTGGFCAIGIIPVMPLILLGLVGMKRRIRGSRRRAG